MIRPDAGLDAMHVVHIVETLDLGGMERAIATLCRAQMAHGVRTSVVALKGLGVVADDLVAAGVPVHLAGVPVAPPDYLAWRRVVPVLRRLRPTVVHTHNSAALIYGAPSARWCGVRTIVHTDHGRVLPDRRHIMLAERLVSSTVCAMVAVSAPLAAALATHLRVPADRLRVIANGVEPIAPIVPEIRRAQRVAWFGTPDGPIVGLAARLVWEKGLGVLLDAWPRVLAAYPRARLVIGGEGPERAALSAQIDRLAIGQSVRLPGVVRDMPALYGALDVFVLPSVSEGLPLALLEAMSAGLPIVASAVGGMPAVLAPAQAGRLVPPNDAMALATALTETIADLEGQRAADLGQRARDAFTHGYTADAMASAYLALYRRG